MTKLNLLSRVRRVLPGVIVLALLASVGYWGHHSGWKIPKFSSLVGQTSTLEPQWCDEHGVPESMCVACNAELMPKGQLYGWCREHGIAECPLHHPELVQLNESRQPSDEDFERARQAFTLKPRPENNPACKLHLRRIQFVSSEAADRAGIDIRLADRAPIEETVSVVGQITYDPTLVARLSSRAAGTAWRVDKNVGDTVTAGEVLALVDAVEVGRTKAELLQAVAQLDLRDKTLQRLAGLEGVVPGQRLLEAETARAEADIAVRKAVQTLVNLGLPIAREDINGESAEQLSRHLQFLGLPAPATAELDPQRTTANLIPVTSPRSGVVVSRDVVAGEVIDVAKTLFTVVDNSRVWLMLDVPVEDAAYVAVGQVIRFRPDGDVHEYTGTVTWISTSIDRHTRTVKVRAELENNDGHLRDESFCAGRIVLRQEQDAIVVPSQAVHWEGCCHVVFVRDKAFLDEDSYKIFHTRMVRPGVVNGDKTEVIAGLLPGEVVATKGSEVLRAELLKGNLGAG